MSFVNSAKFISSSICAKFYFYQRLTSLQRKYIDDYLVDRNLIYYPVHLTPGYEAALKANEYQSEVSYKLTYSILISNTYIYIEKIINFYLAATFKQK